MAEELLEDSEEHLTAEQRERIKERLGRALNRMKKDGSAVRQGETRNPRWSLRWEG